MNVDEAIGRTRGVISAARQKRCNLTMQPDEADKLVDLLEEITEQRDDAQRQVAALAAVGIDRGREISYLQSKLSSCEDQFRQSSEIITSLQSRLEERTSELDQAHSAWSAQGSKLQELDREASLLAIENKRLADRLEGVRKVLARVFERGWIDENDQDWRRDDGAIAEIRDVLEPRNPKGVASPDSPSGVERQEIK